MQSKISKKYLILFASIALLSAAGIIMACSGGDMEDFYNSFFAPETSGDVSEKSFYRSNNKFYGEERYEDAIHTFDTTNIYEWNKFFNSTVSSKDLEFLVYHARIGEIDSLIFYVKNPAYPANQYLRNNSINQVVDKSLVKEFLFYLGYAKRCEPYSTYSPSWWDDNSKAKDPRNDNAALQKLITGGKKSLGNVKSEFIRQRYLFQLIRLAFNSGDDQGCIEEYESNAKVFASNSSIKYRSLGYTAGAYYKLQEFGEANYIYSLLFDQCENMKTSAFLSFHPQEEKDWNETLNLAKNSKEKEVLWQLLGIYSDPIRALKEIYKINPSSEKLNLILVRAINIQEEGFIPYQSYWSAKNDSGYALKSGRISIEFIKFLQKVADQKNTNKPYLWDLTAGYLSIVNQEFKVAESYLTKASNEITDNNLVKEQIRLFRLISLIEQYKTPSVKADDILAKELNWLSVEKHDPSLRINEAINWANRRLSEKYLDANLPIIAQCLNSSKNMPFYNDAENMKALVSLMDKKNKTAIEKYALKVHPYSRADIIEYEAINLLYQFKFRDALAKFEEDAASGADALPGDPFVIHNNDCHDCDHAAYKEQTYTKYDFVKRLVELSEAATGNPVKASNNYFLLANGLYNMTYFGNARAVYESKIQPTSVYDFYYSKNTLLKDPIYDCSRAEKYYNKARELSPNLEDKALNCFMAAKCEQNRYYCSSEFDSKMIFKPGIYFQQLKKEYSRTQYYKEIIEECGYFSSFVKH